MGKRHPIFTDEHELLRDSLRRFIEAEVAPHADEWEAQGSFPHREVFGRFGELGFLGIDMPEDAEVATIGGLLSESLGRIPVQGDTLEWNGYRLTVHAAGRRGADLVSIVKID